jgi:hypothetical protein
VTFKDLQKFVDSTSHSQSGLQDNQLQKFRGKRESEAPSKIKQGELKHLTTEMKQQQIE